MNSILRKLKSLVWGEKNSIPFIKQIGDNVYINKFKQFCYNCHSDNLLIVDTSKLPKAPKDKILIRCMSCSAVMKIKKDLQ